MPDEPEVHGLLALMLLHDARREARFRDGELVLLADQDRSLWDAGADRGGARRRSTGRWRCAAADPYVVQAAIASLHAEEPRDWPQIAALYGELAGLTGSPVVELSRAVAVAEEQRSRGRPRDRRSPRAGGLPLPALDAGRAAAPPRPHRPRPATPTAARWRWSTTTPSGACSSAGSPSCADDLDAPGWIRTSDPRIRSPMLYPAELRGRGGALRESAPRGCDARHRPLHRGTNLGTIEPKPVKVAPMSSSIEGEEDLTRKQRREQAREQRKELEQAEAASAVRRTRLMQLGIVVADRRGDHRRDPRRHGRRLEQGTR